uniref:Uncharacterized protein n=1 Tax=Panagrolaimus sp. ES5 TaxID=591445 RepID=A0AC34F9K7_9BILA
MATTLTQPPPLLEKRASETSAILPNGGDSVSSSTKKPSRQSTFKSSGSQENGNPRQRFRLNVPEHLGRPSLQSDDSRVRPFGRFDKLRRLSRAAYDLPRKNYFNKLTKKHKYLKIDLRKKKV